MKMTMNTEADVLNWRSVNDGVMGGLSLGGPSFQDDHMVFSGVINTNGGGFSSIRARVIPGALTDMGGLKFRVKSDGRRYKATLRTGARIGWRQVSFQAELPATPIGVWADASVPFADLRASLFGRAVRGEKFNPAKVQSIGIILADGTDGGFELKVKLIEGCRNITR